MNTSSTDTPGHRKHELDPPRAEEISFRGIPASPGIAIASCVVIAGEQHDEVRVVVVPVENRAAEHVRYDEALAACIENLRSTYLLAEREIGNVASILETYELILTDITINEGIRTRIDGGMPAEHAISAEYDEKRMLFVGMKDEILRERAVDIDNVKDRILSALRHRQLSMTFSDDVVVIASSVIPHDVVIFNDQGVRAIVTEVGGITSHSSIMARSLSMPAVIGVKNVTSHIESGSIVIVDGNEGILIVNPGETTLERYQNRIQEQQQLHEQYAQSVHVESTTKDGHRVRLLANVDLPEEVTEAIQRGAEGIGLVRTEILVIRLDRFPSEDEQTQWYTSIAERAYPRPVTFRAFDIGTDKYISGLPQERNPALGIRGIRYLLQRSDVFRSQVRAVLRASHLGNVQFMLPMVTGISEIEDTLLLLAYSKEEMHAQGMAFDATMPVGMMIETPSSALLADHFAKRLNFFSIGSNDLTQYVLAADRGSDLVSGVYDTFHPAVLRLMKTSVDAAHAAGIPVNVCGEFGSHSAATDLLVGMGVDGLSVSAQLLPELKNRILQVSHSESLRIFETAMQCARPSDVRKTVEVIQGNFSR
jgi:phosphotransferase system enzyme I (PtsI)